MSRLIKALGDWTPRDYQKEAFNAAIFDDVKFIFLVWHRRSGKDDFALRATCLKALNRVGSYWHLLPQKDQARKVLWDQVDAHTGKKRVKSAFSEEFTTHFKKDMKVEFFNGSNWSILGSDSYDSHVGSAPCGLVFSEWALANPAAWAFMEPMINENNGFVFFITTPRGKNHAWRMFERFKKNQNCFVQKLTNDDTKIFTDIQIEQARQNYIALYGDETIADSLIRQEYYCDFNAAVLGSVFGKQIERCEREKRLLSNLILHEQNAPVSTVWDLGWSDATACWFFQIINGEIRVLDFWQANFAEPKDLATMLLTKAKKNNFKYETHYFPHDAVFKLQSAGGKSMIEQLLKLGVKGQVIPATSTQNSISAGRMAINNAWFDNDTCFTGLEHLRSWHYGYSEKNRVFSEKPIHDHNSHASDAWCLLGRVFKGDAIKVITEARSDTAKNIITKCKTDNLKKIFNI